MTIPKDEERCEAVVWPNERAPRPYRCFHRAKFDAEGHRLCGVHNRTYLRGTRIPIYGGPGDWHGCKTKARITYVPPNADEKRYMVEFSNWGHPPGMKEYGSDWRDKWDAANPDKAAALREYAEALLKYAERCDENARKARERSAKAIAEAEEIAG